MSKKKRAPFYKRKQTEAEWLEEGDRFYLRTTPKWFTLIEWIIITGVLRYLYDITKNKWIAFLYVMSYLLMFGYIQASIFSSTFIHEHFYHNKQNIKYISVAITFLAVLFIHLLVLNSISEISSNPI